MYRHGRFSKEAREVVKHFRELARTGEALLARTLDDAGLGRKLPARLRRKAHVKRVLKSKAKGEQQ
jgi:hypothetical protein